MPRHAFLLGIALAGISSGCLTPPPTIIWQRAPGHQPLPLTLSVKPLRDLRPGTIEHLRDIAWVPLVPFAPTTFHRPGDRLGLPDPANEIPRALAEELIEARVFREVDVSSLRAPIVRFRRLGESPAEFEVPPPESLEASVTADLLLEGRLRTGRMKMWFTAYGLSFAGTSLWMLGWPMRRIELEIDAVFHVVDARTGERIWTHRMHEVWGQWQGIYYGRSFYRFPELTDRGVRKMILAIDRAAAAGVFGRE